MNEEELERIREALENMHRQLGGLRTRNDELAERLSDARHRQGKLEGALEIVLIRKSALTEEHKEALQRILDEGGDDER